MANRYRRNSQARSRKSRQSGGSLSGVFILLGVVIGILVATSGYMFFSKPTSTSKSNSVAVSAKTSDKLAKKEKASAQRFEFYTLLPGMEVQLPDSPSQAKNQSHPKNSNSAMNVKNSKDAKNSKDPRDPKESRDSRDVSDPNHSANSRDPSHASQDPASHARQSTHSSKESIPQYIVQAGIFQDLNHADELKAKLTLQGFNPLIQKVQTQEGHTWFRVTCGPFMSEVKAVQQKKQLEEQKIRAILILKRPNT